MTDELTPQEQEALKSLPRERMPAGLEARVTDAMREHGFLEKRRRTIAITNSRVTGLLAACVALVIGAYSIGLHRGGDDRSTFAVELKPGGGRTQDTAPETLEKKENTLATAPEEIDEARENEPTFATDDDRSDAAKSKVGRAASPGTPPAARSVEEKADRFRQITAEEEGLATSAQDVASAPRAESPAAKAMLSESADRLQPRQKGDAYELSNEPYMFLLNGSRVIVDAPDSVRVVQDEGGRTLLIYTSDGIIRIHLAD